LSAGADLVWLRDDFRVGDQPAIHAAAKQPTLFVYIRDESGGGSRPLGGAAKWRLVESLTAMGAAFSDRGGRLDIGQRRRRGNDPRACRRGERMARSRRSGSRLRAGSEITGAKWPHRRVRFPDSEMRIALPKFAENRRDRRRKRAPKRSIARQSSGAVAAWPARLDGRGAASDNTGSPSPAGDGMQRVTLIDNYDSFTFNLVHYLGELGADVSVWRNDEITVEEALADEPDAIVLSPGPCTPNEAGVCLDLVRAASKTTPMLGVCLGHQAIGQAFGGDVVRAPAPMHGKVSRISHNARGLFRGLNGPFSATRYHSLVIERSSAPAELEVNAESDDGLVMGVQHRDRPTFGVQFHPESIVSEHGRQILHNFLDLADAFHQRRPAF
jgi:anthranilate synthase component II